MKIVTWNVNGIRACAKKGFVEFLEREEPDILCLQETKAEKEQVPLLVSSPESYKTYWSSSEMRKGYSGTATYVKKKVITKNWEKGIGKKEYDKEGRFVVTHHKDFILYNVYFPNGAASEDRHSFKQNFLKDFLKYLLKQIKQGHSLVVVGDYNVAYKDEDVYDPKKLATTSGFLPEERSWFETFLEAGFVDTFRLKHPHRKEAFSWWSYREMARSANRGWRIDHICVTSDLASKVECCEILSEQMGSDHCPVSIEINES